LSPSGVLGLSRRPHDVVMTGCSCTRLSVAAFGRDRRRAASDAAARGNAVASSARIACDPSSGHRRASRHAAGSRSVTIERWSTEHGDCVLRSSIGVTSEGEVAMRRLAFSGEPGRRLAAGETTTGRANDVLSATSSTPRVLSTVGDGLPSRSEGARKRCSRLRSGDSRGAVSAWAFGSVR
jgi:hypothetical protein